MRHFTESLIGALDPLSPFFINKKHSSYLSLRNSLIGNRVNLLYDAVRCSQHVFVVDERPAAELSSSVEERGDPRPFARVRVLTTDDALLILITVLRAALREITVGVDRRLAGRGRCRRARPPHRFLRRPRRSDDSGLLGAGADRLQGREW